MKKPLNALIVEDSADDAKLLIRVLTRGGYEVQAKRVETAEELSAALENARWDVVLSDYSLPNFSGEAALRMIRESGRDLPFIFVSGMMGEEIAVAAMKAGAHDYVMKNNPARLVPAIERELRDAIERHQHRIAEKQMRMSEHKYRHLFRSMSDAALLIAEGSGRLIDANEQAEVVFGRTRDELLGLTSDDLYSQTGDQPWPEPPAPGGLQGSAEGESVVRRLNGSVVPVHVCVSRVELYDRPFRLALFRDISQRKRAEAALRAVLRHARTIVMDAIVTAPDDWSRDATDWSVADFGWELHFQDVEAAQAVLPLEVPPGKHYRDFWDTARLLEDRTAMAGVATRAFATGAASWQQEFRSRDRYGRVHTFMQAALIEPLGPTQWRVTTVNTDISDRVAAEEALRTSEERLATIFNLSPTAICIVRASDGRFVEINHAFETGTGYSRTEIIGHTSDELNLWSDLDERAAIVREVEAKGTAVAFKLKGRRKGGEVGVGLSSVTRIMLN
ncbi:MAG TPA: PAS domain S-box protein, partial [Candidatus Synoicihabitans sp.]|nr:PAS domain S-box protein [Candidatus Synoicihabitans sp.]